MAHASGWWCCVVVVGAAGRVSAAQPEEPPTSEPAVMEQTDSPLEEKTIGEWTLQFEPAIWAPGLAGDVRLPGGTASLDTGDFDFDDPQITPFGEIHFRQNRLTISASGFGFSLDETGVSGTPSAVDGLVIPAGTATGMKFDLYSAQATGAWRIVDYTLSPDDAPDSVRFAFDVYGGIRGYDLNTRFTVGGAGAQESDGWVEPIIGARFTMDIIDQFTLDLALDGGWMPFGDHESSSFDITVGIQWRPVEHFGAQFGWRQIVLDLSDGDGADEFSFDGSLAGIYGSIVIRF